jgi:hypothetical protein
MHKNIAVAEICIDEETSAVSNIGKLVKDFSWLNITALSGIDDEFNELLRKSPLIDNPRRDALCFALHERAAMLAKRYT